MRLVNRKAELRTVLARVEAAMAGQGGAVLLAGEAGIGKSRLALEIARLARERGLPVLVGRCPEDEGAPSYWPWIEILRSWFEQHEDVRVRPELRHAVAHVAGIVPEVRDLVPDLPVPTSSDSAVARFRLFDSVGSILRARGRQSGLMLVLEDLHRADTPTLLLLRFLAPTFSDAGLLALLTYRDTEVEPATPVCEAIADLGTQPHVTVLPLQRFSLADVGKLVTAATGRTPAPDLVSRIFETTEGNPLFVCEVARFVGVPHATSEAPPNVSALPVAVEGMIAKRLSHLPEHCRRVLTVAATIGREFPLLLLEEVAQESRERVQAMLDVATRAHVVLPVLGEVGRYRFAHILVRRVLYERLSSADRAELHERIGLVLEAVRFGGDADPRSIAHHLLQAARITGRVERALEYAARAGERALASFAYEDAVELYQTALQLLALRDGVTKSVRRCELLIGLAEAQRRASDVDGAKTTARQAATHAMELGDGELLAQAALAYGRLGHVYGQHEPFEIALLERALRVLAADDSSLRARLLARLATELPVMDPIARKADLSEAGVRIARRVGDEATLADTLLSWHSAAWTPDNLDERLAAATEIMQLAQRCADPERVGRGRHFLIADLLEQGEFLAAYREMGRQQALFEELHHPLFHWHVTLYETLRATLDGRFGDAEQCAVRGLELGLGVSTDAMLTCQTQITAVRIEQGRLGEQLEFARAAANELQLPIGHIVSALCHVALGQEAEARRILGRFATTQFADIPRDMTWLTAMSFLAEVVSALADVRTASHLYEALSPFGNRFAFVGPGTLGAPSVWLPLGLLAGTLERWEEAEVHLAAALHAHERVGARVWVARTELACARMLLARSGVRDEARARSFARQALATAGPLGMATVARGARAVLKAASRGGRTARASTPVGATTPAAHVFRREGDYWTVAFDGSVCRLKASAGLDHLSQLLRNPGREFLALELVHLRAGETFCDEPSGATPVFDGRARAAYRHRIKELRSEIDDAESRCDGARAEAARRELEQLAQVIAGGLGLGGRARRLGSANERARVNVTRTIKQAMRTITLHLPPLGQHLAATLRTGTFCVYRPDPRVLVDWQS